MKRMMFKPSTLSKGVTMIVLAAVLCSFAAMPGADSFEVLLNDKLILQQYLSNERKVSNVMLNPNNDDKLSINYSHCGVLGTSRIIKLKDDKNNVLKEWKFADAPNSKKDPMIFQVKDIVAAGKGNDDLTLTYTAKESAKELVLATIVWTKVSAHK